MRGFTVLERNETVLSGEKPLIRLAALGTFSPSQGPRTAPTWGED